jgi:hypothetical protein
MDRALVLAWSGRRVALVALFASLLFSASLTAFLLALPTNVRASASYTQSATFTVSNSSLCNGSQNAEAEQAIDPANSSYVYEVWMGCGTGIAFSRSSDGGLTFQTPIMAPGAPSDCDECWDPAVTVGPSGVVYVVFMAVENDQYFPVVDASFDNGRSFSQSVSLLPPVSKNWGDRPFIAQGPDGTVYVTWDYGPSRESMTYICNGDICSFATGDINAVIQWSKDGGKTWSPIVPINPNFPAGGGDSAPILVEPNDRLDVLYQGYTVTNTSTYTLAPAHEYFTYSTDEGQTWSAPVMIGPSNLTMSLAEWWIDGSLGRDSGGNLYSTFDTQGTYDIGWLSYSTNDGATWSSLARVTHDNDNATHIMEVAGGGMGTAYVAWLSDNSSLGYAQYVQAFSSTKSLLLPSINVSQYYGNASIWPGDTFGISWATGTKLVVSWGSAVSGSKYSAIYVRTIEFTNQQPAWSWIEFGLAAAVAIVLVVASAALVLRRRRMERGQIN